MGHADFFQNSPREKVAAVVAAAPVVAAVGLGAADYGITKLVKKEIKLREENQQLKEELLKENS